MPPLRKPPPASLSRFLFSGLVYSPVSHRRIDHRLLALLLRLRPRRTGVGIGGYGVGPWFIRRGQVFDTLCVHLLAPSLLPMAPVPSYFARCNKNTGARLRASLFERNMDAGLICDYRQYNIFRRRYLQSRYRHCSRNV